MAVRVVDGDLLKSDCDVLMHQCNCLRVMGAGIALAIRKMYPSAFQAFVTDSRPQKDKLGMFSFAEVEPDKFVFNLYGQFDYQPRGMEHTNYTALNNALVRAIYEICVIAKRRNKLYKIGLPFNIGCGLAGGDWKIVSRILERVAISRDVDLFLYRIKKEK